MSKFQIEKVSHSPFTSADRLILTTYYPENDRLSQTNFATEEWLSACIGKFQTGCWRIKSLKNN